MKLPNRIPQIHLSDSAEERKRAVIAARGPKLSETVTQEHVSWCIRALEAAGLHPTLPTVVEVLGRGSQSTILPLMRSHYETAALSRDANLHLVSAEATGLTASLIAFHDALRREVRENLVADMNNRTQEIEMAQKEADRKLEEAEGKLVTAASHYAGAAKAISATQDNIASLQHQLMEAHRENARIEAKLHVAKSLESSARQEAERWHALATDKSTNNRS